MFRHFPNFTQNTVLIQEGSFFTQNALSLRMLSSKKAAQRVAFGAFNPAMY